MNERQRDLAVILDSTRPGRTGAAVAEWAMKKAAGRASARYELIDLADYPLRAWRSRCRRR
jgi:NAD(P)H-dependent FMN reductase